MLRRLRSAVWLERAVFRQAEEEEILLAYLSQPAGSFVDVGANHPVVGSQTYAIECRGWSGILIEPLNEYADLLQAVRSAKVIRAACGWPEHEGQLVQIGVRGGLSTTVEHRLGEFAELREVPMFTLDHLLAQSGFEAVDFVSIDVEGRELDVMRGFTLSRWSPKLVLIEDHIYTSALHRHMLSHGYKRVRRTGDNSWYVPHSEDFSLSPYGRWQLLRKYYLGRPIRRVKDALRRLR